MISPLYNYEVTRHKLQHHILLNTSAKRDTEIRIQQNSFVTTILHPTGCRSHHKQLLQASFLFQRLLLQSAQMSLRTVRNLQVPHWQAAGQEQVSVRVSLQDLPSWKGPQFTDLPVPMPTQTKLLSSLRI